MKDPRAALRGPYPSARRRRRRRAPESRGMSAFGERQVRSRVDELEDALGGSEAGNQEDRETVPPRYGVPVGDQPQPGRVHELEAAQIEDQVPGPGVADGVDLGAEDRHDADVELADGQDAGSCEVSQRNGSAPVGRGWDPVGIGPVMGAS
jgi:hypothetical protein